MNVSLSEWDSEAARRELRRRIMIFVREMAWGNGGTMEQGKLRPKGQPSAAYETRRTAAIYGTPLPPPESPYDSGITADTSTGMQGWNR